MPGLDAVIFDFDGVVVDTEPLHYQTYQDILVPEGLGYSWETYNEKYIGFDDRDGFREAFRQDGRELSDEYLAKLIQQKAFSYIKLIAKTELQPFPGVMELLAELAGEIPMALCTGALKSDIEPVLDRLAIGSVFDRIVTADDVSASKPDPESYALAFRQLTEAHGNRSIQLDACLAIEDTPGGLQSATGAGLNVLGVTNTHSAEQLHGAWKIVDSLEEVSLERLRNWMGEV